MRLSQITILRPSTGGHENDKQKVWETEKNENLFCPSKPEYLALIRKWGYYMDESLYGKIG